MLHFVSQVDLKLVTPLSQPPVLGLQLGTTVPIIVAELAMYSMNNCYMSNIGVVPVKTRLLKSDSSETFSSLVFCPGDVT